MLKIVKTSALPVVRIPKKSNSIINNDFKITIADFIMGLWAIIP